MVYLVTRNNDNHTGGIADFLSYQIVKYNDKLAERVDRVKDFLKPANKAS